jgi:CRP-like cAMP-binding protein
MENHKPATTYWVWGTDRVTYGPMDHTALESWVRSGRLAAAHWVFEEPKCEWRHAMELPELAPFLSSPPPQAPEPAAPNGLRKETARLDRKLLQGVPVFQNMDVRQIEACLRYMDLVRCVQFSHVVRKGDPGDALYIVLEGELRALTMVDGKESTLTTIGPGASFGEISLLDHGTRSTDVVANQDSVLLRMRADAFNLLLREAPVLALPFLLALSRSAVARVRDLTRRHEEFVHYVQTLLTSH